MWESISPFLIFFLRMFPDKDRPEDEYGLVLKSWPGRIGVGAPDRYDGK